MAISLKDIAEQANLSIATVSRALRGRREIAPETRLLVQDIADRLRYRPNELARSILSGRTGNIGVIFPKGELGNDFYMQVLMGIHSEMSLKDRHAICLWLEETDNEGRLAAQIHSLIDKRVEGFIINPSFDYCQTYVREIVERQLPVVTVDMDFMGSCSDFVGTDDFVGAYRATEYLMNLGHIHIAHISGTSTTTTGLARKQGFLQAVSSRKAVRPIVVEDPVFGADMRLSFELAQKLLDSNPRPTAVFCANDYIAAMTYKAAHRKNLRIPVDLSVVGFADIETSRLLDPMLTTVRQKPLQIGISAAQLLIERTNNDTGDKKLQRILLRPELVVRDSASVPPP